MSKVRILLADDHALVRAGLRSLIEGAGGQTIVAEAANGRDAVALAKTHRPDLVVMDITMTEMNGIEASTQILADNPSIRVLILSMHTSEEFVRRAMRCGASGYLIKDSAPLELQTAIDVVMRGEVFLSSRISRHLVSALDGGGAKGEVPLESLTPRHREVLQMIAEGKSTKAMAFALKVSIKTVETHRAALMDRIGIHDLAGLVIYAVRHKLVSLEPR